MVQNLQNLWTNGVLESLLAAKPNLHTFLQNLAVAWRRLTPRSTWPRAQHEQWAVLKEMDSNCCLMVSKSLKYFRRVLTQGYEPARLMGAIGMAIAPSDWCETSMPGNIATNMAKKSTIETGPRKIGLMIKVLFCAFLLCKKAASSKRHHNRSVHVGSQRMSSLSDFWSIPARLKMAWPFKLPTWLMQIRSKKTSVCGRQKIVTKEVTIHPEQRDQHDHLTCKFPNGRSKPGSSPNKKSSITRRLARKPKDTAAVPL